MAPMPTKPTVDRYHHRVLRHEMALLPLLAAVVVIARLSAGRSERLLVGESGHLLGEVVSRIFFVSVKQGPLAAITSVTAIIKWVLQLCGGGVLWHRVPRTLHPAIRVPVSTIVVVCCCIAVSTTVGTAAGTAAGAAAGMAAGTAAGTAALANVMPAPGVMSAAPQAMSSPPTSRAMRSGACNEPCGQQ